tara:strand:- start:88 stop:768 length:681 start_codon:yes stop_codon:yes gene_type:complete
MIDCKIEIDSATQRKMEEVLRNFAAATGKTIEDGINEIARGGAKQMAMKVQPYGITGKAKQILHGAVAKQAHRAISNANVQGIQGTAASVHIKARVRRGRVPKDLTTQGQYKRSPIPLSERNSHVDNQVKKIGRAKAAWIEAGEKVDGTKITVQKWLRNHVGSGYGAARKKGKGMGYTVELENSTPYIRTIQFTEDTAAAMATALKNGFNRLQTIIDKEIEKVNNS